MTSGTPWSVKGIDPRARAIAKTAARREGMTLGEWLNRVILEDGPIPTDWSDRLSGFPGFGSAPDGDGGGGDDDLHEMIARLGARIEAAESRAQLAISGVDQPVNGLARRLERIEDGLEEDEESTAAALTRMRASQDELMDRLRKLERNGGSGDTAPVRAVETALGKVAARLYETERDFRAEIDGLLDREERRKDGSEKSIRSLAERIEDAERRTRAEEQSLRDLVEQRHKDMSKALEGMHDSSRTVQRRLVAAESATHQAAEALAKSHERLEARLAQLEHGTGSAMTQEQFQQRFDRLATELAEVIRDTRREFASQVDTLARSGGPGGGRFEQALQATEARLSAAETRQADTLARISQEVSRLARAIDRRFSDNETRLEARFREDEQRRSQLRNQADIESRLDAVRKESSHAVRQIGEQVAKLGETLAERVSNAEERSARALEAAGERMARVVETLDANGRARSEDDVLQERITASEERTAARIAEAMEGVHARLDAARSETAEALSPVQRAMTALAERLETIESNALHEPPRRRNPASAFENRPAQSTAPAPEPDSFAAPLKPPPGQREAALQGEFSISGADSFVVAVEDPLSGDQRQAYEAPVEDDSADVWQEAPAPAPIPQPASRTRAAQVLGATADAEFLSAARRKVRVGGSDPARFDYAAAQTPKTEGARSRWLLASVSLLGFLALGAAAAFILMDGFNRGPQTAQSDISSETLSSLFADVRTEPSAPVETGLAEAVAAESDASGTPAPAEALDAPVDIASTPARPVDASPAAPATPVQSATAQPAANTIPDAPLTLEAAATSGDPVARYQLALQRLEAGDAQGGITLMRRAAEQGVPDAQFRYGRMLERGEGVTADPEAGRQWIERAAEAGHLRAMYEAGVAYVNQSPTPANQ